MREENGWKQESNMIGCHRDEISLIREEEQVERCYFLESLANFIDSVAKFYENAVIHYTHGKRTDNSQITPNTNK